jgi:UDPglucose--hexose-1-phosphate uridylyltransferase
MPELRKDPVTGRWVIIAVERTKRPDDFKAPPPARRGPGNCPFCEGNEATTPPEIASIREPGTAPNSPGWRVRVIPNKFPSLMIEGELDKRGEGIYDRMNGVGAHEVIIESPKHDMGITDLPVERIREVLGLYRERLIDLRKDHRLIYGLIFKNVGMQAGASLEHTHSQLIMTPIVPFRVAQEIEGARTFFNYRGRCIFCDIIQQEISSGDRLVINEKTFVAFEPYASRFPFETWILPKRHLSHYEATDDALLGELAHVLKMTLKKLEGAISNPPYNFLIHTSPLNVGPIEHYHWHFEVIPRITRVAGFEWGTGFYINPVPPENAARYLRDAVV